MFQSRQVYLGASWWMPAIETFRLPSSWRAEFDTFVLLRGKSHIGCNASLQSTSITRHSSIPKTSFFQLGQPPSLFSRTDIAPCSCVTFLVCFVAAAKQACCKAFSTLTWYEPLLGMFKVCRCCRNLVGMNCDGTLDYAAARFESN